MKEDFDIVTNIFNTIEFEVARADVFKIESSNHGLKIILQLIEK